MTPADTLLDRLDNVKPRGEGQWLARCPAHDDRSPSLSVRECDDGRVLVHCFAGCPADDVMAAVGLSLRHLYPDAPSRPGALPEWKRRQLRDAMKAEWLVVRIAAADAKAGRPLTDADIARGNLAASRIQKIQGVLSNG